MLKYHWPAVLLERRLCNVKSRTLDKVPEKRRSQCDNAASKRMLCFIKPFPKQKVVQYYCINRAKNTNNNSKQQDLYHYIIKLLCTQVSKQAIKITFKQNKSTHFYRSPRQRQTDRSPFADRLLN